MNMHHAGVLFGLCGTAIVLEGCGGGSDGGGDDSSTSTTSGSICGGDDAPIVNDCDDGHLPCGTCTPKECLTMTDTPWESCTSQGNNLPGCMDTMDFDKHHGKTFNACVEDKKKKCCYAYPKDNAPSCKANWCSVTTNFFGEEMKGNQITTDRASISSADMHTDQGCRLGCSRIHNCQSYLFNVSKCQWYDHHTEKRNGTKTLYMFNMFVEHFDAKTVNNGTSSVQGLHISEALNTTTKSSVDYCQQWYVEEVWLPAVKRGTLHEGESYIGAAFPSTQTGPHPDQWFGIGVPLSPAFLPVQVSWVRKPSTATTTTMALNASRGGGPGYNVQCGNMWLGVDNGQVQVADQPYKWYIPSNDGSGFFTSSSQPNFMPLAVPPETKDLVLKGVYPGFTDPLGFPQTQPLYYPCGVAGTPWSFPVGFDNRCMEHTAGACTKHTVLDGTDCELGWCMSASDHPATTASQAPATTTCKVYKLKLNETTGELSSFSKTKGYPAGYCSSCQDRYGDYACIRDGSHLGNADWCVATSTEKACTLLPGGKYCKSPSLQCSAGQSHQDFTCESKEECEGCDTNNCSMSGTRGDADHVWAPCYSETGDPWGCIDSNHPKSTNACVQDPHKKGKCCYVTNSIVTRPTVV